jgi:hypothetical protein
VAGGAAAPARQAKMAMSHRLGMKTDRIQTDTVDTDADNFSFSERILRSTVYFLSNSDIHHI